MFYLAKTWKERGLQIQAVKDKCNHILEKLDLPNGDARAKGIIHVMQLCNTISAVPIKLQQNAEIRGNVPIIMQLLGLQQPKDLESCLDGLNKNAKLSFITMTQFAIENCIERVLDAIPGEKAQKTFCKSSLRLLEATKVDDHKNKHKILMVPAWIRNTFHSACIHSRASKTVIIDGESYKFEKGKGLSCGTWSHLMHCLSNALDIYEEMLCSSIVTSISNIDVVS
ncbi:MAG: hypothetical protein FVQ84_21250 [Planctomycetes bacterium]|nr:hypothetical protein [Planctomycetota bacterium]